MCLLWRRGRRAEEKRRTEQTPRGVTKILLFVAVPQWGPGYLFQISCTCRHFSQAFFRAGPAGEYKVVFTYLPLRSQCLPKAACYNVCYHGNILVRAGNLKKNKRVAQDFPPSLLTQFLDKKVEPSRFCTGFSAVYIGSFERLLTDRKPIFFNQAGTFSAARTSRRHRKLSLNTFVLRLIWRVHLEPDKEAGL